MDRYNLAFSPGKTMQKKPTFAPSYTEDHDLESPHLEKKNICRTQDRQ